MAIRKNITIPNDTNSPNQLQVAFVVLTLVAGTATELVPGFPTNTPPIPYLIVPGGTPGQLAAVYDETTDTLTVTSTSALETSIVGVVLLGF